MDACWQTGGTFRIQVRQPKEGGMTQVEALRDQIVGMPEKPAAAQRVSEIVDRLIIAVTGQERQRIHDSATTAYVRDADGALMYLVRADVLEPKEA